MPLFVNNTPVFDVERTITERVRSELIGRGRYKVEADRTGVDAVLTGEILNISLAPAAFNQQQQATRYAHHHRGARIEFRDVKADKVLWQNPALPFTEQYDVTTNTDSPSAAAFLGQNANALERLRVGVRARRWSARSSKRSSADADGDPAAVRKQIAQGRPDPALPDRRRRRGGDVAAR